MRITMNMSVIEYHFRKYFNQDLRWFLCISVLLFKLFDFINFCTLNVLHNYRPSTAQMDLILRDMKVRIFPEKLSGPLCIDDL